MLNFIFNAELTALFDLVLVSCQFKFTVTPTTFFSKLAKSQFEFFVRVYVLECYTYLETAQSLFSLCLREKEVKTLRIYE